MTRNTCSFIAIIFALYATAASAAAVTGRVTDLQTGVPLASKVVAAYDIAGSLQSSATSDATGRFSLTVPPAQYRLLAYDPAGVYATTFSGDADSFETSPVTTVSSDLSNTNFALRLGAIVTGTVTASSMTGGALTVAAYNLNGTRRGFTLTNTLGLYTLVLPPGDYKIAAYDDGGNFWPRFFGEQTDFASALVVSLAATQTVSSVNIRLDPSAHLTGSVIDADSSAPLFGISVLAYSGDAALVATISTNVNGGFDLKVPSGSYRLLVADSHLGYATAFYGNAASFLASPEIVLGWGETRGNLTIPMRRGGTVSGRISDTNGSPLSVIIAAYNFDGSLQDKAQSDASGDYSLLLPPGQYRIGAYDEKLSFATQFYPSQETFSAATPLTVSASQTIGAINFTLSRGAQIWGRVTSSEGNTPVQGITVAAYDLQGQLRSNASSSATGSYAFVVLPGPYRLVAFDEALRYATAYGGGASSYETARVYLESAGSLDQVDLVVSPGVRVGGNVTDGAGAPLSEIEISALDPNGNRVATATSNAGAFTFVLAPNDYKFVALDPRQRYPTTYYGGTLSLGSAATVTVRSGSSMPAITIVLTSHVRRHAVQH